jgi:hypothetical protein
MIWVALLAATAASAAERDTWRWVDERGVVHYSDRPHPGAEKIDLRAVQGYEAPASAQTAAGAPADEDEASPNPYRRFTIVSPGEGETLWNIEGRLDVTLAVDPVIRGQHRLAVKLDGEPVGGVPEADTDFTIGNVYRGEHTLQASIVDTQGRELATSQPVRFFVHETSLLNPNNPAGSNNPNAARPPRPTPRPGGG